MPEAIEEHLNDMLFTWNTYLQRIWSILTTSPKNFKGGQVGTGLLWQLAEYVGDALQGVGIGLLVLFFAIGIVKTCSSFAEVKRPEVAAKLFVRFALAKLAITNGRELMINIIDFFQALISNNMSQVLNHSLNLAGIAGTSPDELLLPGDVVNAIHGDLGFWNSVGLWIVTFFGCMLVTVLSVVIMLTVYGRFFKLYIYVSVSPLMLSTFASESTQNVGKTFAKNFVAVCLEGVVILVIFAVFIVYTSLSPVIVLDFTSHTAAQIVWGYIIELVINLLIVTGSVKTCDRLVRDMIGH